uniref:Crossover junction endonuclease MUS81 n=2 Tax=Lygus hesperus TaxID=30085 RepID=A0A0A9X205_LYGHE
MYLQHDNPVLRQLQCSGQMSTTAAGDVSGASVLGEGEEFSTFVERLNKHYNVTSKELFTKMLKQIKGFGYDQAFAVADFFGTLHRFMQYRKYFSSTADCDATIDDSHSASQHSVLLHQQCDKFIELLCTVEFGPGKKLGPSRAQKLIHLLWCE